MVSKPVLTESGAPISEEEALKQLEFNFDATPALPPNTPALRQAIEAELQAGAAAGQGVPPGGQGLDLDAPPATLPPPSKGEEQLALKFEKTLETAQTQPPADPMAIGGQGAVARQPLKMELRLTTRSVEIITEFARKHPEMLLMGDKRLFKEVADVLRKEGGASEEFVEFFVDTISGGGKQLHRLSELSRSLAEEARRANPRLASIMDTLDRILKEDTAWGRAMRATSNLINIWRGLLVSQLATVIRNIEVQFPTYTTRILDKWVAHHLGGKGLEEAEEMMFSMAANFKALAYKGPKGLRDRLKEVERLVVAASTGSGEKLWLARKLMAMQVADMPDAVPTWVRGLNFFNIWQDRFFRLTAFDGIWRGLAREAGLDVAEILADPQKMPTDIFKRAVQEAMEITYAGDPTGKVGKAIMQLYDAVPPVALVHPFPRFYINAFNFLLNHSPAGIVRIWPQKSAINRLRSFLSEHGGELDPRTVRAIERRIAERRDKLIEQISMSMVGTLGLAVALGIRASPIAGPKYYQIDAGDGRLIDIKPFNPLTGYLFFADVLTTMSELGVDYVRTGGDLSEALNKRFKLNKTEFVEGLTQLSTRTGVGLPFLQAVFGKVRGEETGDLLVRAAGEFIGGFSVPFRAVTDIVQGLGLHDNIVRDSRDTLMGPALRNIPWLSEKLPELATVTRGEPVRSEHPLIRQFTGLNIKKRNAVEQELDKLRIETHELEERTGQPELDRKINRTAGAIIGYMADRLISSEAYKEMNDPTKRLMWAQIFSTAKRMGRLAALSDPELREANIEEIFQRVRAPVRDWLREDPRTLELRRRLEALGMIIP